MVQPNGQRLIGVKEICSYVGREWEIIRRWVSDERFPARKIDGRWESWKGLVDDWFLKNIEGKGELNGN